MWLLFALLTPLLFAVVHVVDAHCVDDVFERPWFGFVTSALASLIVAIPLPVLLLLSAWESPSIGIVCIALVAGSLIQWSQLLYFAALEHTETGIVAAYWNLVPVMVVGLSFALLHEVLSPQQYVGIAMLIGASVAFCMLDVNLEKRWQSLFLMTAASGMQAIMFLLEEIVYREVPYPLGFTLITAGLIATGLTPIAIRPLRQCFSRNIPRLAKAGWMLIGVEVVNILALASSQRAVDLGIPSLVSSVETTIPAYTFLLSLILLRVAPPFGNAESRRHLPFKLTLVGAMTWGVYLLA